MSTGWRVLTRQDLKAFDDDQTKAVLYAMDNGGIGRISAKGHAIIRNTTGQTMSVSRNGAARTKQNTAADLCRLFGAPVDDVPARQPRALHAAPPQPETASTDEATLACPANGCEATFVTEGARYSHVERNHPHRCDRPGCGFATDSSRGLVTHRRIVHEGWAPRRGVKDTKPRRRRTDQQPQQPAEDPKPVPPVRTGQDAETLQAIRELLGQDPRIAQLQERVTQQQQTIDALVRERDDALAQLALVREALHLNEAS